VQTIYRFAPAFFVPMRILVLALLVALSSCSNDKPQIPVGFTLRTVTFKKWPYVPSPHGRITLHIPVRFDTLLTWVDKSDNQMSDRPKYRFTNSQGCLIQETGFFKRADGYCKDTLDRLTIETEQMPFTYYNESLDLNAVVKQSKYVDSVMQNAPPVWRTARKEGINGRTFIILEFNSTGAWINKPYEQINAHTEFRQGRGYWHTTFRFECKQKNCQEFAENVYATLHSVRIDTLGSPSYEQR
jgi:hypothetical protein